MRNTRAVLALIALASFAGAVLSSTLQQRAMAARNSSGTYTLPSGNPVTTKTTITSSWANTTLSDIGAEITNSLDRTGRGAMTGQLQLAAGAVAAPALTWSAETASGLYRAGAGDVRMSMASTDVADFASTGVTFPVGVTATQTAASGNAITATGAAGTGAGAGGAALVATGGAGGATAGANGVAITATGGTSANAGGATAITATGGTPTGGTLTGGSAITATGGASTSTALNGVGLIGTGGANATATGGTGVSGTGGTPTGGSLSGGTGIVGQGGAATGAGVGGFGGTFFGGTGNGIGLTASGSGTGVAIRTGTGGLQIGTTGTAINASYSASFLLTFGTVSAGACTASANEPVTGASVGDLCVVSADSNLGATIADCRVSASGNVVVRVCAVSGQTLGGINFRVRVFN